jgi:PPOX class probable F420-dependent enzyme
MMTALELTAARYVSFATFRKSGVEVATPVWCAADGGEYFIFSAGDAGKVKRLRNNPRAKMAVCDARGELLGDWHDATAVLITGPVEIARALSALRRKYGWQMRLADLGAKLTGRYRRRAYIKATLTLARGQR